MPVYGVYRLILEIVGRDRTRNVFQRVASGLGAIFRYGTAIVGAQVLFMITQGIRDMVMASIEAVATFQLMELTLASLAAREMVKLSNNTVTVAEVFGSATVKAEGLMDVLTDIAILSPFTVEATMTTFRMAMAFGFTTDQAMVFTEALLNQAAGIGATNSMLDRMAYNLAQVRLQGKVTALDIRQLALAGFDLVDVLRFTGDQMGVNIQDHLDFNAAIKSGQITWEDFVQSFGQYAKVNFAGASERMARSLYGLRSTFHDVFVLTMPKLLGPAAETVTDFLNLILNRFIAFREAGVLEKIGEDIKLRVMRLVGALRVLMNPAEWYGGRRGQLEVVSRYLFPQKDAEVVAARIDWMLGAFQRFRETMGAIWSGVTGVATFAWDKLIAWWDVHGPGVTAWVSNTFGKIREAIEFAWPMVVGGVLAVWDRLAGWWEEHGPGIVEAVSTNFGDMFGNILTFLQEQGPGILKAFGSIFGGLAKETEGVTPAEMIDAILSPLVRFSEWLVENGPTITSTLQDIGQIVGYVLVPALIRFGGWAIKNLPGLIGGFFAFTNVLRIASFVLLTLPSIIGTVTSVLIALTSPIALLAIAIGLLAAAWINNWGGIRDKVGEVWEALQPIFESVRGWLEDKIGSAIEVLSDLWTNTLLPAIQGVQQYWEETAQPFWEEFFRLIDEVWGKVVETFSLVWENKLLPVLEDIADGINDIWQPIKEELKPIMDIVVDAIETAWLATWEALAGVFNRLQGWVKGATEWISKLADKVAAWEPPEWLHSDSPAPIEMVFMNMIKHLQHLSRMRLPDFSPMFPGNRLALAQAQAPGAGNGNNAPPITIHIDRVGDDMDLERMAYEVARRIKRRM